LVVTVPKKKRWREVRVTKKFIHAWFAPRGMKHKKWVVNYVTNDDVHTRLQR
jgi:hypothetical protein